MDCSQVTAEVKLKHNDRLILGNAQAFRVVDPLDPEASKPKQLIDWDLAQVTPRRDPPSG